MSIDYSKTCTYINNIYFIYYFPCSFLNLLLICVHHLTSTSLKLCYSLFTFSISHVSLKAIPRPPPNPVLWHTPSGNIWSVKPDIDQHVSALTQVIKDRQTACNAVKFTEANHFTWAYEPLMNNNKKSLIVWHHWHFWGFCFLWLEINGSSIRKNKINKTWTWIFTIWSRSRTTLLL